MISQVFDQLAIALALVIAEAHDGFACRPSTDDALQQLRHVLKSANSSEISKVALSIDIVWTDPDVVDHHYEVVTFERGTGPTSVESKAGSALLPRISSVPSSSQPQLPTSHPATSNKKFRSSRTILRTQDDSTGGLGSSRACPAYLDESGTFTISRPNAAEEDLPETADARLVDLVLSSSDVDPAKLQLNPDQHSSGRRKRPKLTPTEASSSSAVKTQHHRVSEARNKSYAACRDDWFGILLEALLGRSPHLRKCEEATMSLGSDCHSIPTSQGMMAPNGRVTRRLVDLTKSLFHLQAKLAISRVEFVIRLVLWKVESDQWIENHQRDHSVSARRSFDAFREQMRADRELGQLQSENQFRQQLASWRFVAQRSMIIWRGGGVAMLSALAMNSHYLWWCRNIPGKQLEKLSLEMNHRADFCLWLLDKHHASWRSLVEQLLPSVPADLTLLPPHCLRDEDSYVISRSGNLKAIPGSYKIISNCEYNRTEFKFDPQILPRSNKGGICPACQTLCVFADPKVRQPARYEIYETEDMGNGARALESIQKGNFVDEITGEIVHTKSLGRAEDAWEFGPHRLAQAKMGSLTRFFNHQCRDENCVWMEHIIDQKRHLFVLAKKDICVLDPLLLSYGQGYWREGGCKCSAPDCFGQASPRGQKGSRKEQRTVYVPERSSEEI